MRPVVYQNVKELSYRELLEAISNIKKVMNNSTDPEIVDYPSDYYQLLVEELDNRQKEIT